jgi:hypothetical protein
MPAPKEIVAESYGLSRWNILLDSISIEPSAQGKRIRIITKGEEVAVFDLNQSQVRHLVSLLASY